MEVNKVVYDDETLIDLTGDTVTEDDVLAGIIFHGADGSTRAGRITLANYLDKTYSGTNALAGRIQVGAVNANVANAYLHVRNVGTANITGAQVNGACFSVNGDGTASFQHKTYDNSGGNAKNAAVLRFYGKSDKTGKLQFAVNSGTGNTPTEDMYKDVAMVDDIPSPYDDTALANRITVLENWKNSLVFAEEVGF